MKTNKFYLMTLILIVFTIVTLRLISATYYSGSLHQHTGYSTVNGYDGNYWTFEDNCFPIGLEGHTSSYRVYELKEKALDESLDWLAFSDHSYCIDNSDFNDVESDCNAVDSQYGDFTCLTGEEVSAAEIVDDIETIPRGFVALGIIVYLNEIGVI